MSHEENSKGANFLNTFMEHATTLTNFEKRHHRSAEPNGMALSVASLDGLALPGCKSSGLKTVASGRDAGILKIFPRAADKKGEGQIKE